MLGFDITELSKDFGIFNEVNGFDPNAKVCNDVTELGMVTDVSLL